MPADDSTSFRSAWLVNKREEATLSRQVPNMNEFEATKQWLLAAYHIKVSDEWLAACLEWIQQEFHSQGEVESIETLKKQVFEQWLLSDLAEIGEAILPTGVGATERIELTSDYPLQLLSSVDVGFPLYGQCQKLQGQENVNAGVSADHPLQPAWEPKSSRTLLLEVSDGHTSLQALEHEAIPCLHTQLPSGTKLYVRGPVLCRRGVLLLRKDSVQVLGGEVDALMEANNPLATLHRHMEQNRRDEGKHAKKEFSGQFLHKASSDSKGDFKGKPTTETKFSSGGGGGFSQTKYPVKQELKGSLSRFPVKPESSVSGQKQVPPSHNNGPVQSVGGGSVKHQALSEFDEFDDAFGTEWDEDLDYNELFKEEMEVDEVDTGPSRPQQEIKPVNNSSISYMWPSSLQATPTHVQVGKANPSLPVPAQCLKVEEPEEENYFDDDLELLDIDIPFGETPSVNPGSEPNDHFPKLSNTSYKEPFIQHLQTLKSSSPSWSSMSRNKNNSNTQSTLCQSSKITSTSSNSCSPLIPFQAEPSSTSQSSRVAPMFKVHQNPPVPTHKVHSNLLLGHSESASIKTKLTKQSKLSDMFAKSSCPNNKDSRTDVKTTPLPHNQSLLPGLTSKASRDNVTGSLASESKPSHAVTPKAVIRPFQKNLDLPFQYLSQVTSMQPPATITIKAYISTLTDKLNCCGGSHWSLSCKINDGTASMDVDIDNDVLRELIGFSAQDSVLMRQEMKVNPLVKDKLMKGLQACQQKLVNMSSLMDLQLTPGRPVVRKLSPITRQHVLQLMSRIEDNGALGCL